MNDLGCRQTGAQGRTSPIEGAIDFSALAASIAHEVRQPLAGIVLNTSTCVKLLTAEPVDLEAARETARLTLRDAERAAEVIAHLRTLFAGRRATREWLDLNEAAREVIALLQGKLQECRVNLRAEFLERLPRLRGDRVQLQQVILNLLLNATEAMSAVSDRPRLLVVKTEEDAKYVHFSVRDAGVGFAPEDAGRLFEPLYSTKSHGMGLGLSVSRSIIESHQGRISADLNKGGGATISFSIPRADRRVTAAGDLGGVRRHGAHAAHGERPWRFVCTRRSTDEHYAMEGEPT
jgi:C4-dicarboxylate-specific signal transduction histidine kinase